MFPVFVHLTDGERHRAAREGRRRFAYANAHRYFRPLPSPTMDPEIIDIQAAGAELAVAKFLNLIWTGEGDHREADVGDQIQVRYTTHDNGGLIIRPRDPDPDAFVLVVGGLLHDFRIIGWTLGKNAKIPRWAREFNGGGHCYLIPQTGLRRDQDAAFLH